MKTTGYTVLMNVSLRKDTETLKYLIDYFNENKKYSELTMQNKLGKTALILASSLGYVEGVNLLKDYEAGIQSTVTGETALMAAV